MGIRFKCHHCEAPLNVKSELASKRGVCPKCHGKFRIPVETQSYSLRLDEPKAEASVGVTNLVKGATSAADSRDSGVILEEASTSHSSSSTFATPVVTTKGRTPKPSSPTPLPEDRARGDGIRSGSKPVAPAAATKEAVAAEEPYYFVRPPSGGEYGPATKTTIEEWISQRRVTPDSMVCKLGTDEWLKAKDVFVMKFLFP
jgi:hypothetical protein